MQNLNPKFKIVFFGSFQKYSVQVLEKFLRSDRFKVVAAVTTPPKPADREQELKPTEVQVFSQEKNLPVLPLEALDDKSLRGLKSLKERPDFLVVAGYGKLIPPVWLEFSKIAPINIHFSLLPDYPGRFPAEWAILMGEKKTGVTIIKMSPKFDKGEIISQREIQIEKFDTREMLYKKLYDLGGDLAVDTLPKFAEGKIKLASQDLAKPHKYARQITREDGFVPWEILVLATQGQALFKSTPLFGEIGQVRDITGVSVAELIERMLRAFKGWPGVWTIISTSIRDKRLKILKGHLEGQRLVIDAVQFEGKSPVSGKDAISFLENLRGQRPEQFDN